MNQQDATAIAKVWATFSEDPTEVFDPGLSENPKRFGVKTLRYHRPIYSAADMHSFQTILKLMVMRGWVIEISACRVQVRAPENWIAPEIYQEFLRYDLVCPPAWFTDSHSPGAGATFETVCQLVYTLAAYLIDQREQYLSNLAQAKKHPSHHPQIG